MLTLKGQERSQAKLRLPCGKFGLARQDFEVDLSRGLLLAGILIEVHLAVSGSHDFASCSNWSQLEAPRIPALIASEDRRSHEISLVRG